MSVTLESAVFMGKNYLDNCHSITNYKRNTCSTYLQDWCLNKMRSLDWEQLIGKIIHGNTCYCIGDERVINLQRTKVYVFSDSVLCLVKIQENPNRTMHGKTDWDGSKHLWNTETLTESTVSQWTSSGIFPRIQYVCSSVKKSKVYC